MVRTVPPYIEQDQEVPDRGTRPSLLWRKQASNWTMWCQSVWLRISIAAGRPACLLCLPCPHRYRHDTVTVETDHEPLKSVLRKEIQKSLKRLQRIRLALEKYNLEVQYKKGPVMYIADAMSRAYLNTTVGPGWVLWDPCPPDGESRRTYSSWTS